MEEKQLPQRESTLYAPNLHYPSATPKEGWRLIPFFLPLIRQSPRSLWRKGGGKAEGKKVARSARRLRPTEIDERRFKKRFSKKAVRIEREGKTKIKTKPLIRVTKLGSVVKGSVNGMSWWGGVEKERGWMVGSMGYRQTMSDIWWCYVTYKRSDVLARKEG